MLLKMLLKMTECFCLIVVACASGHRAFAQTTLKEPEPTIGAPSVSVIRNAAGNILVGANPNSDWDQFHLLGDPQVQAELQLSKEIVGKYEAIAVKLKSERAACLLAVRNGTLSRDTSDQLLASQRIVAADSLKELLTPVEQKRLQQVVYRIEVVRVGLAHAFTNGYLSLALGTYSNQESGIQRKALEIEQQLKRDIQQLQRKAEEAIIAELTPEQAKRALEALGEPLKLFEERTDGQELFQSVLARESAARTSASDSASSR